MRIIPLLLVVLALLSPAAIAVAKAKKVTGIAEPVVAFPHLTFKRPLLLAAPPDGSDRIFVVEQEGKVSVFPNDPRVTPEQVTLALDLRVRRKGNEEGMLGLAFHPDFHDNRYVFLPYSMGPNAQKPSKGRTQRGIISRFTMNESRTTIDPDSEKIILEIKQPWGNHNGGHLAFGEDGYLYIALGDGGSGGDPKNVAQDLTNLLGSILRLDIDHEQDGKPYAIPQDNPFINSQKFPGARPEIYAYGLRNVWRFSFDRKDHGGFGQLWAGDVGQNKREEIDIIQKGGNYGWRIREGFAPFKKKQQPNPPAKLLPPVVDHQRSDAGSITGGYVYRGRKNPLLQGAYVYGDYLTGKIFLLRADSSGVRQHQHFAHIKTPASFGLDQHHELYVCSFDGKIYKFIPAR